MCTIFNTLSIVYEMIDQESCQCISDARITAAILSGVVSDAERAGPAEHSRAPARGKFSTNSPARCVFANNLP
jgi:hypothetical protein